MASLVPVNPTPFLAELTGSAVVVRLKWGMEYKGILKSTDKYMNLQLVGTEEWIDGALAGNLGEVSARSPFFLCPGLRPLVDSAVRRALAHHVAQVLIRCNNVLFVRAANSVPNAGDSAAEASKKRRVDNDD